MTFTAEHCTMLMPYAAELGLSHHEILNLDGKASIVRACFDLVYLDGPHFDVRNRKFPQLYFGPGQLPRGADYLRQFLPLP